MSRGLLAIIPKSVPAAKRALGALERDIGAAKTYDAIRKIERAAEALKLLFRNVDEIREQAEQVIVLAEHRQGTEAAKLQKAKGAATKGSKRSGRRGRLTRDPGGPTYKELLGSKKRGMRVKKLAAIPEPEIKKIIANLHEDGKEATVTSVLKAAIGDDKATKRAERERVLAKKVLALPDKRYGVIVADPEWRLEPWSRSTGMDRAADNHYPTSCLEVIKARDVPSIAAKDCVLFLWATIPMLPHALAVMEAWGFDYKSHYAWGKDKIGTGYWSREQHELLLIGTRGKVPCPAPGTQSPSLITAPRGKHSEKPECFLAMIERYFPNVPKIELNRRGAVREGWDAWGDESIAA